MLFCPALNASYGGSCRHCTGPSCTRLRLTHLGEGLSLVQEVQQLRDNLRRSHRAIEVSKGRSGQICGQRWTDLLALPGIGLRVVEAPGKAVRRGNAVRGNDIGPLPGTMRAHPR